MIKVSSLYKFIIIVFVSFMIGVPLLFPNEILGNFYQRFIIVLGSLFLSIPVFLHNDYKFKKQAKFLNHYLFIYLLVVVIMIVFSKITYDYSWGEVMKHILLEYLLPIAAFPIIFIFYIDDTIENLIAVVSKIVLFMLLIRMFSWLMYNYRGEIYFPRLLFQYEEWIRDGFQRVESGMIYGITLVFVAVQSLNNRISGLIYKCIVCLMLLFLIFITRVRFQTFISILTIFVIYFSKINKTKNGYFFKILIFVSGFYLLVFDSHLLQSFISRISTNGEYGASTAVRFQGLSHYLSIMSQNHSYFGLGFLLRGNPIADSIMARNSWSIYYLDDLGIFGTLIQIGIFTILTHILLFVKAIKVVTRSFRVGHSNYKLYSIGLTTYLIGSCLLLNIFDRQRIFDVPFYLAIFSFLDAKISEVYSEETLDKDREKELYG